MFLLVKVFYDTSPMEFDESTLHLLEEHLKSNPKDAMAWNIHGVIMANKGEFGEALRSLDRAIQLDPQAAQAHLNRGRILMALGPDKAQDALRSLDIALQLSPDNPEILIDKARALRFLGKTREEEAVLLKIVEAKTDIWQIWVRLGDISLENGEFETALKYYKHALDIKNDIVSALMHQAIAYSLLDRVKEAIKSAEKATRISPDDVSTWRVLADVHIRAERFKSARRALKRARELDPSDPTIPFTMGLVEYKDKHLKEAAKLFKAAIKKKHDYIRALHNLGLVLMELEEWNDAADVWERLTSIVKNDPAIFDAKATTYAKLQDYCSAYKAWERARKLFKQKDDSANWNRVSELARAARINCSRQKKAARAQREREKATRSFNDRFEIRMKKKK